MSHLRQILQPSLQALARIKDSSILQQYESFIDTTIQSHSLSDTHLKMLDSAIRAIVINLQVKGMYQDNQDDANAPIVIQQIHQGLKQFYDCLSISIANSSIGINTLLKHPMYATQLMPIINQMKESKLDDYIDSVCDTPECAEKFVNLLVLLQQSHQLVNFKNVSILTKLTRHIDSIEMEIKKMPLQNQHDFEILIRKFHQMDIKVSDKSQTLFAKNGTSNNINDYMHDLSKKGPSI